MLRTAKFLNRKIKAAWSAGVEKFRPLMQGARALALAGLVSLPMLAPSVAYAQDFATQMHNQTTATYIAFYTATNGFEDQALSWQAKQRAAAIGEQMIAAGVTRPDAPGFTVDETRVQDFITARAEEQAALDDATTPEQRWHLAALSAQADEQGLAGWKDPRFIENPERTAELVAQSRAKADQLISAMIATLGLAGGLGAIGLAVGGRDNRRRNVPAPSPTPEEYRPRGGDF